MVVFLPIRMGSPRAAGSSHPDQPEGVVPFPTAKVGLDVAVVMAGFWTGATVAVVRTGAVVVVAKTGTVVVVVRTGESVWNNGLKVLCCTVAKGAIKASNTRIL